MVNFLQADEAEYKILELETHLQDYGYNHPMIYMGVYPWTLKTEFIAPEVLMFSVCDPLQ